MHPVVPKAAALQAASVKLYRQRSRGVAGGTCTRFVEGHGLVPQLVRHRPQSAWSESNTLLSLIGQRHDPRATGGKRTVPHGSYRTSGCHTTRMARRQRIERCEPGFGVQAPPRGQRKKSVPPEGVEPSPATFARLCPVRRTVACGPEGWSCTSDHGLVSRALCS